MERSFTKKMEKLRVADSQCLFRRAQCLTSAGYFREYNCPLHKEFVDQLMNSDDILGSEGDCGLSIFGRLLHCGFEQALIVNQVFKFRLNTLIRF